MDSWNLWQLATRLVIAIGVVIWSWNHPPTHQVIAGIAGAVVLLGATRPHVRLVMLLDVVAVSVLQTFSVLWLPLSAWIVVVHRRFARVAAPLLLPSLALHVWLVDGNFLWWSLLYAFLLLSLAYFVAQTGGEDYEPLLPLPDELREQWEQQREAHRQLRFQYQQLVSAHRDLTTQRNLERLRLQVLRCALTASSLEETAQQISLILREQLDAEGCAIWLLVDEQSPLRLVYASTEGLQAQLPAEQAREHASAALSTHDAQVWSLQNGEGIVGVVGIYLWKTRESAQLAAQRFASLREVVTLALQAAVLRHQLQQESRTLQALYEIGRLFLVAQTVEDGAQQFVGVVAQLVGAPFITLYLYSLETGRMEEVASVGAPIRLKEVRGGQQTDVVEWVIANARPLYLPRVSVDDGLWHTTTARMFASLVGIPLFIRERVGGVLFAAHSIPNYFTEHHVDQLAIAASQFAQVIERMYLTRSVGLLALTDGLTGVFNRRYMEIRLDEEIRRCQHTTNRFCVILIDVDHFKRLNDTLGHATGDLVLQEVTRRLSENLRETDMVFRYGGEEFLVMLPDTPLPQATGVAERIRLAVQQRPFRTADGLKIFTVTMSAGVAEYPTHGTDKPTLLAAADQALYLAKQNGRNRVEVLPDAA